MCHKLDNDPPLLTLEACMIYLGNDRDMLQRRAAHQQSTRPVSHVVELEHSLHMDQGHKPTGKRHRDPVHPLWDVCTSRPCVLVM